MTDEELAEKVKQLRAIAEPVGPLHGFWDVIADAEAHLTGEGMSNFVDHGKMKIAIGGASFPRPDVERMVQECLDRLPKATG